MCEAGLPREGALFDLRTGQGHLVRKLSATGSSGRAAKLDAERQKLKRASKTAPRRSSGTASQRGPGPRTRPALIGLRGDPPSAQEAQAHPGAESPAPERRRVGGQGSWFSGQEARRGTPIRFTRKTRSRGGLDFRWGVAVLGGGWKANGAEKESAAAIVRAFPRTSSDFDGDRSSVRTALLPQVYGASAAFRI